MTPQTIVVPVAPQQHATLYVAVELSMSSWLVGLVDPRSGKISRHQIPCGDVDRLMELVDKLRSVSVITVFDGLAVEVFDGLPAWASRML